MKWYNVLKDIKNTMPCMFRLFGVRPGILATTLHFANTQISCCILAWLMACWSLRRESLTRLLHQILYIMFQEGVNWCIATGFGAKLIHSSRVPNPSAFIAESLQGAECRHVPSLRHHLGAHSEVLVSPEILCPDSKRVYPWLCRRRGRRKLLRTCSPSAAPDRVIFLAVPADAFPTSSKIFFLPNYCSVSLCPQDLLPHVWYLPGAVPAGSILISGCRSSVWRSPLPFLHGGSPRLNNSQSHKLFFFDFVFLNLCSAPYPAGPPPSWSAVSDQTSHPRRDVTKAEGLLILPGSLYSYFYVPFCHLPFSQQHNVFDWCSACDLRSPSILYCGTAA